MIRSLLSTTVLFVSLAAWAQPIVVTSIFPYFDLTRQLTGSVAEVHLLLPPGASPHTFDPTPQDVAVLLEAELIIMNGGVDKWLFALIEASGSEAVVLEVHPELEHSPPDDNAEIERAGELDREGHEHQGINPHVWLDPLLMEQAVDLIAEKLTEIDPGNRDFYNQERASLKFELRTLDQELSKMLRPIRGAAFVPFHDAWPHFAARYGLDLVVEIEPFPGREPSPRYVAQALELIRESDAKAVFNEAQLNPRPAEVVAESAGVGIYTLDPLGGTDGKETYQELLRYNAEAIFEALAE
jgi:ABC-type Zn uptake system ZnuABC Zn-binding protein ZnuA